MRKKMEKLASKLNDKVMYFTENPVKYDDRYYGCKYFLCWQNTRNIFKAFRTQSEAIESLKELIDDPIVWVNGVGFKVIE